MKRPRFFIMESEPTITFCIIPDEVPSDIVPMLIVLGTFLLAGWLIRRWKRKRRARTTR